MVRVVPGVPDSDILEQSSVHPHNVVCPGPHHLSLPTQIYNLKKWVKKGTFDILNDISENFTLVKLMETLGNVNHAISIV